MAEEQELQFPLPKEMSDKDLYKALFPSASGKIKYKMPDYEYVYKELQRDGVTLDLLWREYVDECRLAGELPYQSTQFNKYYNDFCSKKNATMHLNHKPGEIMQVDWAGDTAGIIDTDTRELLKVYVFVAKRTWMDRNIIATIQKYNLKESLEGLCTLYSSLEKLEEQYDEKVFAKLYTHAFLEIVDTCRKEIEKTN